MADTVTLKTRLQLKYDSYANWTDLNLGEGKGANFVLKAGEIGICYLPTNSSESQVTGSQPPQILFKVGNGSAPFAQLPWASAKAADVYEWAKQANLPITKVGDGNVVADIAWDEATKGIKITTASVATSEDLTKVQETANQAKQAIDAFLASADASEKAIDTLKEIQSELDKGAGSAADMLAEINKIKEGTTVVPNATNAQTAASASALDATGVEQVKGIKVNSAINADSATNATKLGGTAASGYLLKTEATGYDDILTKTLASTTYQPKGDYATAAQGALADSAVQPADLNSYYTKTEAEAAFMNSTETGKAIDDKITALNLSTTYEPIGAETRAKSYADGLAQNYATAAQGALAASALQSIEAGAGLSVSNKNKIDFDAEAIFVFNCGSSTSII